MRGLFGFPDLLNEASARVVAARVMVLCALTPSRQAEAVHSDVNGRDLLDAWTS